MDPPFLGVMQNAVTVLQFEISSGDLWSLAVIVRQFEISLRVFSPVVCLPGVWLKIVRWECGEKRR